MIKMPSCIICHMEIEEIKKSYEKCPNGHFVHSYCLREWLTHSNNCPLCNTTYSNEIINKYQNFIREKERQEEEAISLEIETQNIEKIKNVGNKIAFMKIIDMVNEDVVRKDYDLALEKLEKIDINSDKYKQHEVMFLKGKINFLKGRFDLAINNLFKLVKENYEYPDAFLYLGKSYQALGLNDKARWAFERV